MTSCRRDHAGSGGELGVEGDLGEEVVRGAEGRAGVEAVPADPQDRDAEPDQRHRVPRDRARPAIALRTCRCRGPSNSSAARAPTAPVRWTTDEPAKSITGLPPTSASKPPPIDPVSDQRIDDRAEYRGVDRVGAELDPLQRRSPDDRQGDCAEQHPEQHQSGIAADRRRRPAISWPIVEEEPFRAEDLVARKRRDPEADRPPRERHDAEVDRAPLPRLRRRSSVARSRSRAAGIQPA